MSRVRKSMIFLVAVIAVLGGFLYQFQQFIYHRPLHVDAAGYVLVVPLGMSVEKIADTLAREGILPHPLWFIGWVRLTGACTKLQAGEYLIKPGTTPQSLIQLLVSGKVIQHALTIVEGWNFEQLMAAVNGAPKLKHMLAGLTPETIMEKIGHPGEHPEGRFYPETYYFPAGMTDVAFLQRAYALLEKKLSTIWANRSEAIAIKTPYEILILASIIEKESNISDEYGEISGVYHRRLERNMPLQADPTVIYGAGKLYAGKLTTELLKQPNPYNTRRKRGLPPTPIAMSSEKALIAASHPKIGETLYFVAKSDGKGHVFSKTLEEHELAVANYRKHIGNEE